MMDGSRMENGGNDGDGDSGMISEISRIPHQLDNYTFRGVEKDVEELTPNQAKIISLIKKDNSISAKKMSEKIGISLRKTQDNISRLKRVGFLKRIGPAKGGHWKIIKEES